MLEFLGLASSAPDSSFLSVQALLGSGNGWSNWVATIHAGDWAVFLAPCSASSPVLSTVGLWGVNAVSYAHVRA